MLNLRSLILNLAMYGWTGLLCLGLLWTLPLPRRAMLRVVHFWLAGVEWIEKNIGHLTYTVRGREHVPPGACIVACKHQSAWETFKLHRLFDDPAVVLKEELLNIPFWGWYVRRAGMIPIDRAGGTKALGGMMRAAHAAVREGRKIVIFPQGTRLAPGVWKPYKSGVAALYQELKLPVVPMAHNSGLFCPKGSFVKKPGSITIEFLPPIPPGLTRDAMMARLERELEGAANRLLEPNA